MSDLGRLLWWKVGTVDLTFADLEKILQDSGIDVPHRPIPIDVFRKMTSTAKALYTLGDGLDLECTIAPVASSSDKMLVHHLVGTVKRGSVTETIRKIGEVVFYKPPRGQNSKARVRFVNQAFAGWEKETEAFIAGLRRQYDVGVAGALDGQAIRRLVRAELAKNNVRYVDGPYFYEHHDQISAGLQRLFDALGEDSFIIDAPFPDTERNQDFLARKMGDDS